MDSSRGCWPVDEKSNKLVDGLKRMFEQSLPAPNVIESLRRKSPGDLKAYDDFLDQCDEAFSFDEKFVGEMRAKLAGKDNQTQKEPSESPKLAP